MSAIRRGNKHYVYKNIGFLFHLPEGLHEGRLLGSSNGLVCISPTRSNILVLNPETREVNKLKKPLMPSRSLRFGIGYCFGFGYDSLNHDYKAVIGFKTIYGRTHFQMLTLKTNNWEDIGSVNYSCCNKTAILCNGALHWVAYKTGKPLDEEEVILSFDLSGDKFKEIPHPDDWRYKNDVDNHWKMRLGIMDGCLCAIRDEMLPNNIWVMKDYNVKQSWELVVPEREIKTDIVLQVKELKYYIPNKRSFCYEKLFDQDKEFLESPLYIPSLVSPNVCRKQKRKRQATGSK